MRGIATAGRVGMHRSPDLIHFVCPSDAGFLIFVSLRLGLNSYSLPGIVKRDPGLSRTAFVAAWQRCCSRSGKERNPGGAVGHVGITKAWQTLPIF